MAPNGNIQILGSYANDTIGPILFLFAYQPDGTLLWTNYYMTNMGGFDPLKALNDADGNIYIAELHTSLPEYAPILVKFDTTNGDTLWTRPMLNSAFHFKEAAVDTLGGFVYVLFYNGVDDYFQIVKCNFVGDIVSSWQYDRPEYSNDNVNMILCDRQGNLVLQTASGNTASTTLSRRLIKYNA
ncbi:MAG: hypothetical protein IT273_04980, partial [Chitinophagales bacterium]|nr:hypothetical protein [Chitinophagales bacterium]